MRVVDNWRDALNRHSWLSLPDLLALHFTFLGDDVLRGTGSLVCRHQINKSIRERGRVGRGTRLRVGGSVTKMIGFSSGCGWA